MIDKISSLKIPRNTAIMMAAIIISLLIMSSSSKESTAQATDIYQAIASAQATDPTLGGYDLIEGLNYEKALMPRISDSHGAEMKSRIVFYDANSAAGQRIYEKYADPLQMYASASDISALSIRSSSGLVLGERLRMDSLMDDGSILTLKDVAYSTNISFGYEQFSMGTYKLYDSDVVRSYAINLEGVNFTNGTYTATARGNVLYKCKDWNFTMQSCTGSWQKVLDLVPGQDYSIELSAVDPGYAETFNLRVSRDIAMAALDNRTIVIAWIDTDGTSQGRFEIWQTNGSQKLGETVFDASGNTGSRVAVSPINNTHFVISEIDGPSSAVRFFVYDDAGNLDSGGTAVQAGLGTNMDVEVCSMNDRFQIAFVNDTSNNGMFAAWNLSGVRLSAAAAVIANMNPLAIGQNLMTCGVLNTTHWVYGYYSRNTNTINIRSYRYQTALSAVTNLGDAGTTGQIAMTGMRNKRVAVVFYNATSDQIGMTVRTINAATITITRANTVIESMAQNASRVAVDELEFTGQSYFVASWFNMNQSTIEAAVYDNTGAQITAPFNVTKTPRDAFPIISVVGTYSSLGMGLCDKTFAIAYSNGSNTSVWETYWYNGSRWNGYCPETIAPMLKINYPANNTINNYSHSQLISYNVSDDNLVMNCSLYINGTFNMTTVLQGFGNTSYVNFTANLSNGNYNWSIICFDIFGNRANSSIYNITMNTFDPIVTYITAPNSIVLNAGSTRNVICNASVNDGNGNTDIENLSATLTLYNTSTTNIDSNSTKYTNNSCSFVSSSGNNVNYTCSFQAYYYATNGTWYCNATSFDAGGLYRFNTTSTSIDTLYAINLSALAIDYGDLSAGLLSQDKEINVTNFGNMAINITVRGFGDDNEALGSGYAMLCVSGSNITISNQRYSISSALSFVSKSNLTSSNKDMNLTVRKQQVPTAQQINRTYWQLYVPPMPVTHCNGTIVFTATAP